MICYFVSELGKTNIEFDGVFSTCILHNLPTHPPFC